MRYEKAAKLAKVWHDLDESQRQTCMACKHSIADIVLGKPADVPPVTRGK